VREPHGLVTEAAIAAWRAEPRTTPGGQRHDSALAITTALTLRAVFRLALRQTKGLIGSILRLPGLDLAVPDHSALSRRAKTLQMPSPRSGSEPVHLLENSTGLRHASSARGDPPAYHPLDLDHPGDKRRVAAVDIGLHGLLLGFEAQAALTLTDRADLVVGDECPSRHVGLLRC